MKKWRLQTAFLVLCMTFFGVLQVHAEEIQNNETAKRINRAEELQLEEWIDEEGYLIDSFFEGKSDAEVSNMNLDGIVRTLSREDVDIIAKQLHDGLKPYVVNRYLKVSQVNPDTGRYLYTGLFEVDGILAFCIERDMVTPPQGSPTGDWIAVNNENIRKVLYYGYNGPAAKGYTFVETAMAVAEANGHGDNSMGRKVLAEIILLESPPEAFKAWKVETNDGSTQELAFYTYEIAEGIVKIQKSSANTSITNGNGNYSLLEAEYAIYSDTACKEEVGYLVTDTTGTSNEVSLTPGTYYVKEVAAPQGYELNTEVKTVTVETEQTVVLEVKDVPKVIKPELVLQKVDKDTGLSVPQGNASLEDARFLVKYYVNEQQLSGKATREWTLKTDQEGKVKFETKYLVSGDAFWKNASGENVFPLGIITVEEIQAPKGYTIHPGVFTVRLSEKRLVFDTIRVDETITSLELIKYNEGFVNPLEGASFQLRGPNGFEQKVITDSEGKVAWKGLEIGKYTLEEIEAPPGYMRNRNVVEFEITGNGKIQLLSQVNDLMGKVVLENNQIKVENRIGYQLPNTGSCLGIVCSVAGAGSLIISIANKRRREL